MTQGESTSIKREALVPESRLDQWHELLLVAGEAARNERRAQGHRQQHRIDRRLEVGLALLRFGADVGRGGELALRQAVHAVVLDDVQHVQVAADGVAELPQPDGQGVAVAGDADVSQIAVGGAGAHGDRGHAAVDGIEPVAAADEVGSRLRRAADARELHDILRLERQLPGSLDDRGRDRVVAATGAQGGQRALVLRGASAPARSSAETDGRPWVSREMSWGSCCASAGALAVLAPLCSLRGRISVQHALDDECGGDRQAAVVQQRAQLGLLHRRSPGQQAAELRVAILLDDEYHPVIAARKRSTSSVNGKARTRM